MDELILQGHNFLVGLFHPYINHHVHMKNEVDDGQPIPFLKTNKEMRGMRWCWVTSFLKPKTPFIHNV